MKKISKHISSDIKGTWQFPFFVILGFSAVQLRKWLENTEWLKFIQSISCGIKGEDKNKKNVNKN